VEQLFYNFITYHPGQSFGHLYTVLDKPPRQLTADIMAINDMHVDLIYLAFGRTSTRFQRRWWWCVPKDRVVVVASNLGRGDEGRWHDR